MMSYEKILKELRAGIDLIEDPDDAEPAIGDAEQTMSESADLLEESAKALIDIATLHLPGAPHKTTVSIIGCGPLAVVRARKALKVLFPGKVFPTQTQNSKGAHPIEQLD